MSDLLEVIQMAKAQAVDSDTAAGMLASSPAFVCLDNLLKQGSLTQQQSARPTAPTLPPSPRSPPSSLPAPYPPDPLSSLLLFLLRVDLYKARYTELHSAVLSTCALERSMLDQSKLLKAIHSSQTARYKQIQSATSTLHAHLQQLQQRYTALSSHLASLSLQRQQLHSMHDDLTSSRTEQEALLRERLDKEKKRYEALLYDLEVRRKEADNEKEKTLHLLTKERKAADDYRAKIDSFDATRARLERERSVRRSQLELLRHEPAKLELNVQMLAKLEKDCEAEDGRVQRGLDEKEQRVSGVLKERKTVTADLDEVSLAIETYRLNIAKRKSNIDEMIGERELEKGKNMKLCDQYAQLNDERLTVREDSLAVQGEINDLTKAVEALKKSYEKNRRKKETVISIVRPLQAQIAEKQNEILRVEETARKIGLETSVIQRSNESLIVTVLGTEDKDQEYEEQLGLVNEDISDLEKSIAGIGAKEVQLDGVIKDLELQRSNMTMTLARTQREQHRLKEQIQLNKLTVKESTKAVGELTRTIRLCGTKYEVLKTQKSSLVQLCTEMEANLAEVQERAKMYDAEMIVLQGEMGEKERHQKQTDGQLKDLKADTEKLRQHENKKRQSYRSASEKNLELSLEVGQLSDVLHGIEMGMEGMKASYTAAVSGRNGVGLLLIDRNDELCLLYEQTEIMGNMLESYQHDIHRQQHETAVISRDTDDIQRRVEIARRQIPSSKTWEEKVHRRDKILHALTEERKQVLHLSTLLETPPNDPSLPSRARLLTGEDPAPEVLAKQIETLEERLVTQRKKLLDAEIQLKETDSVISRLGRDVAEHRSDAVKSAVDGVEERADVRRMERAMQADVSELSMYQAMCVKLQVERQHNAAELEEMRAKLERGQSPCKEADAEWVRRQRERVRLRDALTSLARTKEEEELMATMVVRSTAEVRPNAYIQETLGLPKPYGGLAPFKPSVLGAQLRHFRPPVTREVQL